MTSKINKDTRIKSPKTHSQESIPSFIRKTYDILDERRFPDIIDWNAEGTAIVIKKPTEFCLKVLPAYFKHNNLTSFVRQLNMYNFHKRRTQNLDHIYYHELFQKGKKNLLKEIRRKSHETNSEKSQKSADTQEASQEGQDYSTLSYENQFLKRLYNEAMSKISTLESKVNEMTSKNQSLWSQVSQKSQDKFENQPELTQEHLPMTFGQFSIPPLRLVDERQYSFESLPMTKHTSINSFLNLGEEATESTATEVSQGSPLLTTMDSDKYFDMADSEETFYLPPISLTPQVSQIQATNPRTDLFISRGEMSVGQIFEALSAINEETQESSMLGKRPLEQNGEMRFSFPEPALKRNELSIFSKKGMLSSGIEDREMFRMMLIRESSINDNFELNDVELIDFNNSFVGWANTA
jgi:hypothetical protein